MIDKNSWHLHIIIDEVDEESMLKALEKTVKEIKEGIYDCSEHDDSYMPYRFWTCHSQESHEDHMKNITNSPCGC